MLNRAHAMAAILERMHVLYDRCLEILTRERNDLVAADFSTLLETLREKDEVLEALRALDRDRIKIQDEFSIVMEKNPEELTLKILAEALVTQGGDAEIIGKRLLVLRRNVSAIIGALEEKVKHNKVFVEKSLENIRDVASVMSLAMSGQSSAKVQAKKSSVYTQKAQVSTSGDSNKGTIVERRY